MFTGLILFQITIQARRNEKNSGGLGVYQKMLTNSTWLANYEDRSIKIV